MLDDDPNSTTCYTQPSFFRSDRTQHMLNDEPNSTMYILEPLTLSGLSRPGNEPRLNQELLCFWALSIVRNFKYEKT
jgi:hypothetical protein